MLRLLISAIFCWFSTEKIVLFLKKQCLHNFWFFTYVKETFDTCRSLRHLKQKVTYVGWKQFNLLWKDRFGFHPESEDFRGEKAFEGKTRKKKRSGATVKSHSTPLWSGSSKNGRFLKFIFSYVQLQVNLSGKNKIFLSSCLGVNGMVTILAVFAYFRRKKWRFSRKPMLWCKIAVN
jgi:hypothetical protein